MYGLLKCCLVLWAANAAFTFNLGPADVVFHYFSRENPTVSEALLPSQASLMASSFDRSRRTIFTIHNSGESVAGNFNAFVVTTHLDVEDVNIIAVDWSVRSGMYTDGLGNAPQCGERIATFINLLSSSFSYSTDMIRIVGVGLGGHIAGIAARNSNSAIPHIVALDPSLVGWTHHPDKLNPDDAGVVEVLHATAGVMGYDLPLGDVDFYPNGGTQQTGCFTNVECSHTYSYVYYGESIDREVSGTNEFIGTACEDYESAITFQCSGDRDIAFGGTAVKSGVSGIYFFSTFGTPPFAQG